MKDEMCIKFHEYSNFTIIFNFPYLVLHFYKFLIFLLRNYLILPIMEYTIFSL